MQIGINLSVSGGGKGGASGPAFITSRNRVIGEPSLAADVANLQSGDMIILGMDGTFTPSVRVMNSGGSLLAAADMARIPGTPTGTYTYWFWAITPSFLALAQANNSLYISNISGGGSVNGTAVYRGVASLASRSSWGASNNTPQAAGFTKNAKHVGLLSVGYGSSSSSTPTTPSGFAARTGGGGGGTISIDDRLTPPNPAYVDGTTVVYPFVGFSGAGGYLVEVMGA